MGRAKNGAGPTLFFADHRRDRKTQRHVTRGYNFRVEYAAVVGTDMFGGASSRGGSNPVGVEVEVSNATAIDLEKYPMLEVLPCFEEGRVGTTKIVDLARVRLSSREAVSALALNIHLYGETLQPFMDFALGEGATVTDRFRFRDTGLRVADTQREGSPYNRCVARCREMTRLVLLANFKSFRLLEDEGVILPCVPGGEDRAF